MPIAEGIKPTINHGTKSGECMYGAKHCMHAFIMLTAIRIYADKPNHNLEYGIGMDFCLENPSNISILLRIDCPLEATPLPEPIYEWTMILNETEVILEASNLQSLGVHTLSKNNQSIDLNATVALRNYATIILKCTVKNLFGDDNETTTISVCSILAIYLYKMQYY